MLNFMKEDKNKEKADNLEFTWEPRKINLKGEETIQDMSLIHAPYLDYPITKTGYLVALIEITGLNLELLNDEEQTYVFEEFNTFLMNTMGDNSNETQQYLDITMPVNVDDYLLSYKKRYLNEKHPERKRLIASYIYDMQEKTNRKEMSTKRHILALREKINKNSLIALESKVQVLDDKVRDYIVNIEDSFEQYDVQAKKLYADEIKVIYKNQMNFNGQ